MNKLGKIQIVKQEQLEEEEEEIKRLFVGIMEGYNDSAIPPFSYFSHLQEGISNSEIQEEGSSSRKREMDEEAKRAKRCLEERKRKDRINENFSVLQSMVTPVFNTSKIPKEKIISDTIEYIKWLEEEIQILEGLKKFQWREPKVAKTVLSKYTSHNSSAQVTVSGEATFLAVQRPFRRALVLEIVKVLEKNQAEVLEARVSVDERRELTFTATIMLGCDGVGKIDKLKEEILAL